MSDTSFSRVRDLKLKQLLVFERTAVLGSTYRAAQALHMSQPNVFKIIGQLESLLGVPLFERHSTGMAPTLYAERLLARVRPMLGDTRAMGEELSALRSGEIGRVTAGTLISASVRLLPEAILRLKGDFPQVHITVREATNNLLFPMLELGELDVVVGRLPDDPVEGVCHCPLYDERLAVVVRAGHPLAQAGGFALDRLSSYPWILPLPESPVRKQVLAFFGRYQLALPSDRVESFSMLTNFSLLLHSDIVVMMPLAAVQSLIVSGVLYELPVGESILFGTIGYSVRTDRKPTPAGEVFIAALEAVGSDIARQA